ncbi:acyl-CoA reductase [Fulvivirga sediminis]|uniref:Acyl-CoA reductase n=1 Tax=Fulvivirga sediminis TaxID=2803949 RepID=A0A937F8Z1_9BACT|nr:acyl-CoA reductase [Fulvivirga sediminis]MBL3657406.1 acyl-CoA reductase [Fulvivirga sediminis]
MNIKERISAFAQLGNKLKKIMDQEPDEDFFISIKSQNPWFTEDNVKLALHNIINYLKEDHLSNWVGNYNIKEQNKKIGIVMAGNIPLVGFHDLLAVIISGNIAVIKISSQDSFLMHFIISELNSLDNRFKEKIIIKDQLKDIDAIIATGSDNTSRYFEYYFSKYPNIIRKNRTSAAILDGSETKEDLQKLSDDIFSYFGLGCRNVSKLFVPNEYNFVSFLEAMSKYQYITYNHKYSNNYDYNKSIYLVNGVKHLDNGFLLLKEDHNMVSPISVLFFEYYSSDENLLEITNRQKDKIQCIVSKKQLTIDHKPLGDAQYPKLWDYADGVDTMRFLTEL